VKKGIVYVLHCIDTEGPLYESLPATFERIAYLTGVQLPPTAENLRKIQKKEIALNGFEEVASRAFSPHILGYNKHWGEVDAMLERIMDRDYRMRHRDSFGGGWVYNWFLLDWVGFTVNPRCRDIGYHNIYDHYRDFYASHGTAPEEWGDEFHWHAHPMSVYREAHKCATSFLNSPHIFESLARRLIDRKDFPRCFRAGFHTERPDSHWFLEQFIPYDFSNQAMLLTEEDVKQKDLANGRFGDWRWAPANWDWYHPSHEDYQERGQCNRVIFRCLNVGTRLRLLTQDEVDRAFCRADHGEDTVLAFTDHDFRNLGTGVEEVYGYLQKARESYPDVLWKNAGAYEAARTVLKETRAPVGLKAELFSEGGMHGLSVSCDEKSFGPQPFLALKLSTGRYLMDNLDVQEPRRRWSYIFDEHSVPLSDIEKIGVATNSSCGSGALVVIDVKQQGTREGGISAERTW